MIRPAFAIVRADGPYTAWMTWILCVSLKQARECLSALRACEPAYRTPTFARLAYWRIIKL